MIDIKDRVKSAAAAAKITHYRKTVEYIKDGMNVGYPDLLPSGYQSLLPWLWLQR